jgi:ABC-2 type transport system permease protein
MKSKIFCFNPAVFRKNALLYAPLWGGFFLVLLIRIPLTLWMNLHSYAEYYAANASAQEYKSMMLYFFYNVMNTLDSMVYVVFGMAVLTVIAVYSYLFFARSSNMMHAFPVTREELFLTNLTTAIGFLLIPEFAAFLVTVLICLANHITCVQYVAVYFVILATESVLFLAMSLFATMLTGMLFAVPVIVLALNYVYIFFRTILGNMICAFAYGITDYSVSDDGRLLAMAPISYFGRRVRFRTVYTTVGTEEYLTGFETAGITALVGYFLAALLFLFLAYQMYRRRPLEKVGDLAAFPGLSPVFRWIIGIFAGYAATTYLGIFLEEAEVYMSKPAMAGVTIAAGVLVFYVAEMLIRKKIRIFSGHIIRESLVFALCLMVSFGMVVLVSRKFEQYIPDKSDIASVNFQLSYAFDMEGGECDAVIDIQKALVAHGQEWLSRTRGTSDYANIKIIYTLKDGSTVKRYYMVPLTDEGIAVIGKASALERDADMFLRANVGDSYDGVTDASNTGITGSFDLNYSEQEELTEQTASVLIDAIRKDARAGTIQKYNSISEDGSWSEAEATKYCGYVSFTIPKEQQIADYDDYESDDPTGESFVTSSISFGTDCVNLIQALIDTGLIRSEDELILYSEY